MSGYRGKADAAQRGAPLPSLTDSVEKVGAAFGVNIERPIVTAAIELVDMVAGPSLRRPARASAPGSASRVCGDSGRWRRGGTRREHRMVLVTEDDRGAECA